MSKEEILSSSMSDNSNEILSIAGKTIEKVEKYSESSNMIGRSADMSDDLAYGTGSAKTIIKLFFTDGTEIEI